MASENLDLEESVATVLSNLQPITWVGHCQVTEVTKLAQGFQVKVILVQSSMSIPEELLGSGDGSQLYTLEWICKTEEHRYGDTTNKHFFFHSSLDLV